MILSNGNDVEIHTNECEDMYVRGAVRQQRR